jgi:zinc transporter ZupT
MDQFALLILFSLFFIGIVLLTFWALHGFTDSGPGWLAALISGFVIVASAHALLRTGTGSVAANHMTLPTFVGGFALFGLAISGFGELSRELDVSNSTLQHSHAQSVTTTKGTEKGGR